MRRRRTINILTCICGILTLFSIWMISCNNTLSDRVKVLEENNSYYRNRIRKLTLPTVKEIQSYEKDIRYTEMIVEATGYANVEECCYPYFDGKTATGRDANLPGVSVDPKVIPYGSYVEIKGLGKFLADDCGALIKGNKIDIRFPTYEEAINWGRKTIKVKVAQRYDLESSQENSVF